MAVELGKFNLRNPAVKRILQEIKELHREDSSDMKAEALEDNIFEWHFAIRGPVDTEFEGGIFHGRILLPPDYPFKPPSFMLLTPNGRFETNVKICLSISSHHPEHWQPSWSVRTALTALIAFMPTPGGGALGSLDVSKEDRRRLAARSRAEPPLFGSAERQQVTKAVHQMMLDAERQSASKDMQSPATPAIQDRSASPLTAATSPQPSVATSPQPNEDSSEAILPAAAKTPPSSQPQADPVGSAARAIMPAVQATPSQVYTPRPVSNGANITAASAHDWEDRGLSLLAAGLTFAIAAILGRRLLIIAGIDVSSFF